jgi:hypothetical protein
MDLTDLWQQHKTFIITVVAAVLVLLLGRTIIGSTYDWQAARTRRDKDVRALGDVEAVPSDKLKQLTAERAALEARTTQLAELCQFKLAPEYRLDPADKSPQTRYFELVDKKQQELVAEPARLDITVPDNLGMPDSTPSDRDEVARALAALNVVNEVVTYAVAARVKRIVKIKYESGAATRVKKGFVNELTVSFEIEGSGRSIAEFFEIMATAPERNAPFLHVAQGSEVKASPNGDLVKATFRVNALTVDLERTLLTKS